MAQYLVNLSPFHLSQSHLPRLLQARCGMVGHRVNIGISPVISDYVVCM